jgi:4-amino-4-deoxy-L-arabinose transferase-like glycosyltransferase
VSATSADPTANEKRLPLWFLQLVVAYWVALKVFSLWFGEVHADEAYYWIWGQHLALSYFDHAPLHSWLQGGVAVVLGWSRFALRFLSLVSMAVVLLILHVWAKRLSPQRSAHTFWLSAALFYSAPLVMLYTTVALHDRVLVPLALGSIHFFAWFFLDWIEGRRRYGALYLGAVLLGLAVLTKYNGALVGVGIALAILLRRDLRSLLRSPHLYAAALLAVAMQAPVLIWNLGTGFASFQFHLGREGIFDSSHLAFECALQLVVEWVLLVSPFALWPLAKFLFRRSGDGFAGVLHSTAKWTFATSSLAILGLSLVRFVLFYWNIVAFAVFFALSPLFYRSRALQVAQILYGVVLSTMLLAQFAVFPYLQRLGLAEPVANVYYGWDQIAGEVREAQAGHGADGAAAASWGQAARLGFALADANVPAITQTTDAYDFWVDQAAMAGQDFIVLTEAEDIPKMPFLSARFESFEAIEDIQTTRFGEPMANFTLYLGRGYIPE